MQQKGKRLKDLAALLGVSTATVSRALSGHERISAETRKRVEEAARTLGYAPNWAAKSLVSGRGSGFAGLVITDPAYGREDSFLGQFIAGLSQGFSSLGTDLFISAVTEGQSELGVIRNIVQARRADGLVLGRTSEADERVAWLLERGFPFVTHGRLLTDELPFSWADTDGAAAFAEAFDLLYTLGHRKFGLVTIEEPMTFRTHRTEGLEQAMAKRADPALSLRIATSRRHDAAARATGIRAFLTSPDRPTAILCLFDGLALAVMREAQGLGLRVPEDISIIGFDNIDSAAHARPGLTTFDSATQQTASALAAMLERRIADNSAPPERLLVRPQLVLRGSHGPAPANNKNKNK